MDIGAVVIGRNEGQRLVRCFESLKDQVFSIVYVDSGSVDGSVSEALDRGIQVIELDRSTPFTAARARNAGLAAMGEDIKYVQVIDGDCELRDGWIAIGAGYLDTHPKLAAVAGRLRERRPEATIWNRLADDEWGATVGESLAIGGTALLRMAAIKEAGGYREDLIAGEEPELCLRLRRVGWRFWRLEDEMAWHDIDMTHFGQWWRRMERSGYAFAEGAALHGTSPERYRVKENLRVLLWGFAIPTVALVGGLILSPWLLLIMLAFPLQILRLIANGEKPRNAFFLTLGKLPEAQGVLTYWIRRLLSRDQRLIEYK